MRYWLMKSEPDVFSLDDLKNAPDQRTCWNGVRNYQARNFMRDDMKVGDQVLYYHSNCAEPGIVGIAEVCRESYPDDSAFDADGHYFDSKSSPEKPRWFMVDIQYKETFLQKVTLAALKAEPSLSEMAVVQKGQRLSVQPVKEPEFGKVCEMGRA